MSWWIHLEDYTAKPYCTYGQTPEEFKPEYDGDEVCPSPCYPNVLVESFQEGGTQPIGGTNEAELNVTYNYSKFYYKYLDEDLGLRFIHNKPAKEIISKLEHAVSQLDATQLSDNYWDATEGNARKPLVMILAWAKAYPEAIFRVS